MSHFTVLVIGPHAEDQLAPFQENNMGNCPEKYLEFMDREQELRQEYETETFERVQMSDGRLLSPHDDEFRKPSSNPFDSQCEVPAGLLRVNVPAKQVYPTFEEFVSEYAGYSEPDEKTGRYGYWENPNAKWDWFVLGGRWTGFFKLKPGYDGETGMPGLMTQPAGAGRADACVLGAIDVEGMRDEAVAEATQRYARFEQAVAGRPVPIYTEVLAAHDGDHNAARAEYWASPVIQDLRAAELTWNLEDFHGVDREGYLQRAANRALSTFAVIKDGTWYERGRMGWWGCVSDEQDENEWNQRIAELLAGLSPDTQLSVYDCHI